MTQKTFEELGLPEKLLKALKDLNFTEATPYKAKLYRFYNHKKQI